MVRRIARDILASMEEATARADGHSEKLVAFATIAIRRVREMIDNLGISTDRIFEIMPYVGKALKDYTKRQRAILEKLLAEGVAAGDFKVGNVRLVAHTFTTALQGLAIPWFPGAGRELNSDRAIAELVGLFVSGIGSR